jgi:hypothetical protein
MKKRSFIVGLAVGIGLSASTVVLASESIQALIFPSKVSFHVNGATKELNLPEDTPILNVNNKTYIPLRQFAQSMGARVEYQAPSDSNGNQAVIDLYSYSDKDFTMHDQEGYISLGQLKMEGNTVSGILRINKAFSGKSVQFEAFDRQNNSIAFSDHLMVGDSSFHSLASSLSEGDVRHFSVSFMTKEVPVDSFQVNLRDGWGLFTHEGFHDGFLSHMLGFVFAPPSFDNGNKTMTPYLEFKSMSEKAITFLNPVSIEYQILRLDGDQEQVLFRYSLPDLEGVPAMSWYKAYLPSWDLRDPSGKPAAPGKYAVQIIPTESLSFKNQGEEMSHKIDGLSRIDRWEFMIDDKFNIQVEFM